MLNTNTYDLFDNFFGNNFFTQTRSSSQMKTDVTEKDGNYLLNIEMPGYKKEDIHAELKDGYLTVSAKHETNDESKDDKGNVIRRERSFGSCSRSFFVGSDITEEDIQAEYKDGVLNLSFPKEKEKLPEEKNLISIK